MISTLAEIWKLCSATIAITPIATASSEMIVRRRLRQMLRQASRSSMASSPSLQAGEAERVVGDLDVELHRIVDDRGLAPRLGGDDRHPRGERAPADRAQVGEPHRARDL